MRRKQLLTLAAAAALSGGMAVALGQSANTQSSQSPASAGASAGATAPTNYGESMVRLQQAAQKLRESVQAMAQQPAGSGRNAAAEQAREAILETQRAMIELPPELRKGGGMDQPNYTQSMARLQEAAQRLRDAVQAMAQQPAGPDRNRAIKQANQALFDTQQAMIELPPDLRTSRRN